MWKCERTLREVPPIKLVVEDNSWGIGAYFPGIDGRHRGTLWHLPGSQIPSFMNTLIDSWNKFVELESTAPLGINLSVDAPMGVKIWVRGYPWIGVGVQSYHLVIASKAKMKNFLKELNGLSLEAEELQSRLTNKSFARDNNDEFENLLQLSDRGNSS